MTSRLSLSVLRFGRLCVFSPSTGCTSTGTSLEVPEGDLTDIVQIKMAIAAKYFKTRVHDQVQQRTEVTQAQCYLTWTPYG